MPETLVAACAHLYENYKRVRRDERFWDELRHLHTHYTGRPTPLYLANRLTANARARASHGHGASIWLKREDLAHTGAHKINNTLGQALLTKRMGKRRIIAETGAGQHGVASATAAAHLGLECEVYMGAEDVRRQRLNVTRMKMLGATVIEVETGSRTLKDATNEAMRDWMDSVEHTHYIIGSVVGPHPFPMIVRDFQAIIGQEAKAQSLRHMGKMPDAIVAWVTRHGHCGFGGGPEHAAGKDADRVKYTTCTDDQALDAFLHLARSEGIIPALESAHAIAEGVRMAIEMREDENILINCSGRGDKDVEEAARLLALRQ